MSTPDLSSPAAVAAFLRQYNTWRRDESELDAPDRPKMPAPADLGRVIDAAVRMLEGRPAGDVPAVMRAAADRIDELERLVAAFQRAEAAKAGHIMTPRDHFCGEFCDFDIKKDA